MTDNNDNKKIKRREYQREYMMEYRKKKPETIHKCNQKYYNKNVKFQKYFQNKYKIGDLFFKNKKEIEKCIIKLS